MVYRATTLVKEDFTGEPLIRSLIDAKLRYQARALALMACSAGHQWPTGARA